MARPARLLSPPPTPGGLVAFLLVFGLVVASAAEPLWGLMGQEAQLFSSANDVRRQHHLGALRTSPALAEVALAHAQDMARNDYLSHVNPEGQDPLQRVQAAGIEGFKLLAENIGSSNVTDDRVLTIVEEWLRSPRHRENLLNPAFNTSGVAVVEAPNGRTLAVQLYATF